MKWWFFVVDIFGILFELYIVGILYTAVSRKKHLSVKYSIAAYSTVAVILCLIYYFVDSRWIRFAVVFVAMFLISLLYDIDLKKRLLSFVGAFLLLGLSELFIGFILAAIFKKTVETLNQSLVYYAVGVLSSKSISFFVAKIFSSKYKVDDVKIPLKIVLAFSIFPLSTFVFGVILIGGFGADISPSFAIAGVISIFALSVANIMVFILFDYYSKQQKIRSELESERIQSELEKNYLQNIIEKQKLSAREMHDLKNQLFAIRETLVNDSADGLRKIDEICDSVNAMQSAIYTGDKSVDALINGKVHSLGDMEVEFKSECYSCGFDKIDRMDLCVVIGNLLDNAIEGVQKVEGERIIRLKFLQQGNFLNIIVVNTYSGEIAIADGAPQTTKDNKIAHGYGLKSIRTILKKYDGHLEIATKDDKFIASVLISNI